MSVAPRTSLLEAKKKEWAAQADMSLTVSVLASATFFSHLERSIGSLRAPPANLTPSQISSHEHYVPYPDHKKQPVAVKTRSFCSSFDKCCPQPHSPFALSPSRCFPYLVYVDLTPRCQAAHAHQFAQGFGFLMH